MHDNLEPLEPAQALEWYLNDKQAEYADATIYSHKSRLSHLVRWCKLEDIDNLNELSGRKLQRYRVWRRADGDLEPVSLKTQMDTVRVFVSWLESVDAVPKDLSTKVRSPSLAKGDNVRDERVTADQASRILDRLSTYEYASERHTVFQLLWHCAFRRGAVVALDVEDYHPEEGYVEVLHRDDQGTPLKNQEDGERMVGLNEETRDILDAWIADRRPSVQDDYQRNPLITTRQGRVHPGTIQHWVYSVTRPCFTTNSCPHDRTIEECIAATDRTKASQCPSSSSPHTVRRGALTHWLQSDTPKSFVTARGDLCLEVLSEHYDRRSKKGRMDQRRDHLEKI